MTEPKDWVSPMVVVPKKSGAVRICIDFSRLNESVKRKRYQLLTTGVIRQIAGSKIFLHFRRRFRILANPVGRSRLTTFLTPQGRSRFTRLPFGLNSGPEVFHRVMSVILEGITGVECYIDDTHLGEVN